MPCRGHAPANVVPTLAFAFAATACSSTVTSSANIACNVAADCGDVGICIAGLCRADLMCVPGATLLCQCEDGRPGGQACAADGSAYASCDCSCAPECSGRLCGADPRCGIACGECNRDQSCAEDTGQCVGGCLSGCIGRQCGPDPTGCQASCGSCDPDQTCDDGGACRGGTCEPDCAQMICGQDPRCGKSCGTCAGTQQCNLGACTGCDKDCTGMSCGLDPRCNQSCGTCQDGYVCDTGNCRCVKLCDGRQCGPDPRCGESCGSCNNEQSCSAAGQCLCAKLCDGRQCGPDPRCGESCGGCTGIDQCNAAGRCYTPTTCNLTVTPMLLGNQTTVYSIAASSNGSGCSVSQGGTLIASGCNISGYTIEGWRFAGHSPGSKQFVFNVASGPNGATSCAAVVVVQDSPWCTAWATPTAGDQNTTFALSADSNATSCLWQIDQGQKVAGACTAANVPFQGFAVAGHDTFNPPSAANPHWVHLYVLNGSNQEVASCSAGLSVRNAPWCTVSIAPTSGDQNTSFALTADSNGSNCQWQIDSGTTVAGPCTAASVPFQGFSVAGHDTFSPPSAANLHTARLLLLNGSNVEVASCAASLSVANAPWCYVALVNATTGAVLTSVAATDYVKIVIDNNGTSSCALNWWLNGAGQAPVTLACGAYASDPFYGSGLGAGSYTLGVSAPYTSAGGAASCPNASFTRY
ncbi:MAG: hypothetical protein HY903_19065 [Deltaproteobacteria bacterium]|nr:hypothetical protein [Deltaproteobacteria bacterium]